MKCQDISYSRLVPHNAAPRTHWRRWTSYLEIGRTTSIQKPGEPLNHPSGACRQSCAYPARALRAISIFTAMAPVQFFQSPGQYIRWASREKPAIFWSIVLGSFGPIIATVVPPIRHRLGDGPRPLIPLTYPSEWTRAPGDHEKKGFDGVTSNCSRWIGC